MAPAPAPAGTGWTVGRIIALAAGSVLLLVSWPSSPAAHLVWADAEQVDSGYVTTSTATYSTSGYALASDSINVHSLGLFVDEVRIRITSSDPSRPLFAGIAATGDCRARPGRRQPHDGERTRRHRPSGHRGPGGSGRRAALGRAVQGTGNLILTWAVQDGDWTVVVMNTDARPGLSVRAEAGLSALALPWLAGELLAVGAARPARRRPP